MLRHRAKSATIAAALALAASATAQAANVYWQGGTGDLLSANYFNGTSTVAPAAGDTVYFGANGIGTGFSGSINVNKFYIGHANTGGGAQAPAGTGNVTLSSGTFTTAVLGSGATPAIFATIIGFQSSGSLTLNNAAVNYSTAGMNVGYGDDLSQSATLTVSNNALFTVANARNLNIGESALGTLGGAIGIPGHVYVNLDPTSTTKFKVAGLLQVGDYASGSSYAQTGGVATSIGINVGNNNASGSTFTFSGGTFNVAGPFIAGRGTSSNTTANFTGGTLNLDTHFLLGTSTTASGIVVNHSAGIIKNNADSGTIGTPATFTIFNFAIADTGTGDATYNLSGTGSIDTLARGVVGRQHGTGVMNQSGGTASFKNTLHLGDQQPSVTTPIDPLLNATGTYNLSGGSLNVTVTSASSAGAEAFSIAPSGTGTFRVIGGDASMSVTGNMSAYANTAGTNVGTLTFQPQPNEPLTTLNVTGSATFNPGSVLQLDLSATKPTQGLFTVLNAASIVNNGTVSLPGGWNYSITPGGNGQLLKFIAGDFNANGKIDPDDYAHIDQGFNQHLTTGASGDLNADGVINAADYLLIDSAFASLGGSFSPSFLASRESEFGPGYVAALTAAVPEPTSLLACGFAIPTLLTRRRRR